MTEMNAGDEPRITELSSGEKRDLLGLGVLAAAWAFVPAGLGFLLLARIGWVADVYSGIIDERGVFVAIGIYALIFGLTAGLGLLPTYAQAILGGWVFGTLFGTTGALAGILLGAVLGHGLALIISGERVEAIIERRPKVLAVRNALVDAGLLRSIGIVALLRVSPNSPFALSNLALGGSRTPVVAVFFGTAIGMLPRTALAAGFAAAAAADGSEDLVDVVRQKGFLLTAVGILTLLVTVAVIAAIGNAALKRMVPGVSDAQSPDSSS